MTPRSPPGSRSEQAVFYSWVELKNETALKPCYPFPWGRLRLCANFDAVFISSEQHLVRCRNPSNQYPGYRGSRHRQVWEPNIGLPESFEKTVLVLDLVNSTDLTPLGRLTYFGAVWNLRLSPELRTQSRDKSQAAHWPVRATNASKRAIFVVVSIVTSPCRLTGLTSSTPSRLGTGTLYSARSRPAISDIPKTGRKHHEGLHTLVLAQNRTDGAKQNCRRHYFRRGLGGRSFLRRD